VLNFSWISNLSATFYIVVNIVNYMLGALSCGEEQISMKNKFAFCMAIVHLAVMGIFGIWLWAKIDVFGSHPKCTPATFLTIFGHDIAVTNGRLRRGSIAIYSMAVIPFWNVVIIPFAATLVLVFLTLVFVFLHLPDDWSRFTLLGGVIFMVLLEVVFVVDMELMISRSSTMVKEGESQWTFGQTLAILMIALPLIEVGKAAFKSCRGGRISSDDRSSTSWD
jgi:hypothetical protein